MSLTKRAKLSYLYLVQNLPRHVFWLDKIDLVNCNSVILI